jgi:hypothetical protein
VHRLCYRRVTGFHGTRVHETWLGPTRKIQLFCPRSKKITHVQRHYVQYCTQFHLKQAISLEGTDRNAFTPLSKIWLVKGRFSQNSQSLNFCRDFLYRISSKSGKKCIKYEKKRYSFCLMVEASDHGYVLHTRCIYVFSINGG